MRTLTSALTALLANSNGPFIQADLFTITLSNGTILRWWTGQTGSLVIGGNTFVKGPPISRDKAKWSMGLSVDQLQLTIMDDGSTTINGQPLTKAAWQNMFDFATVRIDAFISDNWTDTTVGSVPWFQGTVGQIQITGKDIVITIDSMLAQLHSTFPRTYILPSCANTLYDGVCQLLESNFTYAGTVGSSPTPSSFPLTLSGGNKPDGSFQNGKIQFTGGVNDGQIRSVKTYIGGLITLVYPLYAAPAVGDTLNAVFGCDKTRSTCTSRFNNLAHYRGFPYVPDPSVQYAGVGSGAPESTTGSSSARSLLPRIGPRGQYGNIKQF